MISKLYTGIWHPKYQGGNDHLKQYLNANIRLKLSTLVDDNESFLFLGCISRYSQANKQNRLHGRQIKKRTIYKKDFQKDHYSSVGLFVTCVFAARDRNLLTLNCHNLKRKHMF